MSIMIFAFLSNQLLFFLCPSKFLRFFLKIPMHVARHSNHFQQVSWHRFSMWFLSLSFVISVIPFISLTKNYQAAAYLLESKFPDTIFSGFSFCYLNISRHFAGVFLFDPQARILKSYQPVRKSRKFNISWKLVRKLQVQLPSAQKSVQKVLN